MDLNQDLFSNLLLKICVIIILTLPVTECGIMERRLLNDLLVHRSYNKLERPVYNETDPLTVVFGLTLQQIIDVLSAQSLNHVLCLKDEKNQILISNMWLNIVWKDYSLTWNSSEYGGITNVRIPPSSIWKPDIFMYNSADEDIDSTFPTNVIVSSDGSCLWVPPGLFMSTCKIDITWFPFDDQRCPMKFGSWTYDSSGIDLLSKDDAGDISSFITNGEWELLGVPAKRNVIQYECCPEKYIDITFVVRIQRRKLYYIFNLVVPCLIMSCLSLLVFSMPPDAGEKITCGVTILLSLTVFLQLVAETMPPTSDAVPLIGIYFASIMMMCSLSMVFTVLVLNFHHRNPDTHTMPPWVKKGICEWLAKMLRMSRPIDVHCRASTLPDLGKDSMHALADGVVVSGYGVSNRKSSSVKKLRKSLSPLTTDIMHQRSSRSLLANVLDLEDDLLMLSLEQQAKFKIGQRALTSAVVSGPGEPTARDRSKARALAMTTNDVISGSQALNEDDEGLERIPQRRHHHLHNHLQQQRTFKVSPTAISTVASDYCPDCFNAVPGCEVLYEASQQSVPTSGQNGSPPVYDQVIGIGPGNDVVGAGSGSCIGIDVCRVTSSWRETSDLTAGTSTMQMSSVRSSSERQQRLADIDEGTVSPTVVVVEPTTTALTTTFECSLLGDVLDEVRYLVGRVRQEADTQKACSDWKFAAMVVDRLCLWMFSIFTVVSTFTIFFSAPHVVV